MKKLISIVLVLSLMLSVFSGISFAEGENSIYIFDCVKDYVVKTKVFKESHFGVDVDLVVYCKNPNQGVTENTMLYVTNYNGKRIGTESDESIISDYVNQGWIVVTADYKNNPLVIADEIELSLNYIKQNMKASSGLFNGLGIDMYNDTLYAIPAGYRVAKDIWYYDMIENGGESTADVILGVWNSDGFKEKVGPKIPACEYNNYEGGWYEATSLDMCIRPDKKSEKGYAPLIVDLYIDIMYPSKPLYKTPVMLMSSTQTQRTKYTLEFDYNSHLTGYAFDGMTAIVHDHHYVPMARDDHYGYYSVSVPGNYTTAGFSLIPTLSSKVAFAALRCVKYYADTYGYDEETIGVMGISKGSPTSASFIDPNRDWLKEYKTYNGEEYDEIGPQPFLTYKDGTPIDHDNVVCTSTAMGHGTNAYDYFANTDTIIPTMIYCGELDEFGNYGVWPRVMNHYRTNDLNHIAFTMYDVGHFYPYGYDDILQFNRYEVFNTFNKYHLLNEAPSVLWMTPHNNEKNVDLSSNVTIQFVGEMDKESVENGVVITKLSNGTKASGEWISACGGTEFTFVFDNLEPCETYEVNVTKDVKDIKGKNLEEAFVKRFKTKGDSKVFASDDTYIDKDNPDTNYDGSKISIDTDMNKKVYGLISFEDADCENAYKSELSVLFEKSDGAQVATVYGINGDVADFSEESLTFNNAPVLDANGEIDLTKVYGGKAIGSIATDGINPAATCDVSDYILSLNGKTPRFIIASEFKNGIISTLSFDNADGCSRATTNLNVPYSSTHEFRYGAEPKQAPAYTTEKDHTANGGGSVEMIMYPTGGKSRNGRIKFYNTIVSDRPLEKRDIGRTFETSFYLYSESTNQIEFGMMSATGGGGSNGASSSYTQQFYCIDFANPEANTWQKYTFKYTVDEKMVEQQVGMFTVEAIVNADQEEFSIFIDDIETKEFSNDINIVSKESKQVGQTEPKLILYTEGKDTKTPDVSLYVDESKKDKLNSDTLYIQSSSTDYKNNTQKGYFGIDISSMEIGEEDTVKFKFYVNTATKLSMNVYGIDMGQENFAKSGNGDVHNWSETKMNYINAPANDRNSDGVDLSGVYKGAPLATVNVNGEGYYEVDITEYIKYMKSQSVDDVTLIFTPNRESDGVMSSINYENKDSLVWEGNTSNTNIYHATADYRTAGAAGESMVEVSTDVNHTPGGTKSMYFKDRTQNYNRLKLYNVLSTDKNLTTEDIGRKFKITLYAYTDIETDAKLKLGIMAHTGGSSYVDTNSFSFEKGKWVKCEYNVTVNDLMVNGGGDYVANAGFLTVETDKKLSSFYIDDITCEEIFEETRIYSTNDTTTPEKKPAVYVGDTRYEIKKDTYVSNGSERYTNFGTRHGVAVGKGASQSVFDDEKVSYVKFAPVETDGIKSAVLSFDLDGKNTIYIGGVKGNILGNETWNTLVSYPVKKLYTEAVSAAKSFEMDVTDYVKNSDPVFEIRAVGNRGKIVYENDFELMSEIVKESDFRQGGQASLGVSVTDTKGKDSTHSLKLSGFNISYGRLKLFNALKTTPLNTNDIGRKFRVKMSLNPSSTGVTRVNEEGVASNSGTKFNESTLSTAGLSVGFMANTYGSTGTAKGKIYDATSTSHLGVLYTNKNLKVDTWNDIEFIFEIDSSAVTNNVTALIIQPSGMTFAKDVYVDDIIIEEITGITDTQMTLSNPKLTVISELKEEYTNALTLNDPISTSNFSAGSDVILTAVASSFGSDVEDIKFYNGDDEIEGVIIKNGVSYVMRMFNLKEGTYSIKAKALYADGDEKETLVKTFTVKKGISYPVVERQVGNYISNGRLTVEETVKNNTSDAKDMVMIVALYDDLHNLIKAHKSGVETVLSGNEITFTEDIDKISGASYAKVMIWDGYNDIIPLREMYIVE
ncbi:MAG: hypothetical protein E7391_08755 [Ruminococcaceae bacterium]|nr:hypothetical protein [Oscillospiraceae bacterium]